jgi:hypothetical protein
VQQAFSLFDHLRIKIIMFDSYEIINFNFHQGFKEGKVHCFYSLYR